MKNKKGFTIVEIMAIVIILVILGIMAIAFTNKIVESNKLNAFIEEANTFAKAAQNRYMSEKTLDFKLRSDLFNGTKPGRVCYSIFDDLLDTYVTKDKKYKYTGSVELCVENDCDYQYKLWFTDGRGLYIDGKTKFNEISDITHSTNEEYFNSCGYESLGGYANLSNEMEFEYSGSERKVTILKDGTYKLEVWGAQGGSTTPRNGGAGAYAESSFVFKKGDVLYVNVGGQGESNCQSTCKGGYNGGGSSASGYSSGGGATSISTGSGVIGVGVLKKNLIVAAGGGGVSKTTESPYKNGVGVCMNRCGNYVDKNASDNSSGGGGYKSPNASNVGYGGISYIRSDNNQVGNIYCYNCTEDFSSYIKVHSTNDASAEPVANKAKMGNGFAKITLVEDRSVFEYKYTGAAQSFTVPKDADYKFELWGASGASASTSGHLIDTGGSYTSGIIHLHKGQKLYIYVGEQGYFIDPDTNLNFDHGTVAYNGGGKGNRQCGNYSRYGGMSVAGGATDVRTYYGRWDSIEGLRSRIMVAAASGGTTSDYSPSTTDSVGGAGGGLIGYDGSHGSYGTGATQTSGGSKNGAFGIGGNGSYTAIECDKDNVNGGGGGWYGGGGATATGANSYSSGGGGSSYISGHTGCVAITSVESSTPKCETGSSRDCSLSYTGLSFTNTVMIDGEGYNWTNVKGSYVGQVQPDGTTAKGHKGNGFARITMIEE